MITNAKEVAAPRAPMRVLGLMQVLARSPGRMTVTELSRELRSPRSSLLNLLRPLALDGYVSDQDNRFCLGPSTFRLAANIISARNFSGAMRPYLQELALRAEESVYIGVLDASDGAITCVDAINSSDTIRYGLTVGATRPLYSTAAGRLLLAFADPEWVERYCLDINVRADDGRTISSCKGLKSELDRIRGTRIAISMGESVPELGAIAAPLFESAGKVSAVIAIEGPVSRLEVHLSLLVTVIRDVARRASEHSRSAARV